MFLFSVKNFRFWFSVVILLLSVTLTAALLLSRPAVPEKSVPAQHNDPDAYCRSFLSSHGWRVSPDPPEISEVLIPAVFNDVYSSYNALQVSQGYDLAPLRGKTLQKYVYRILDYPGLPSDAPVVANILLKNGEVVGGDICSVGLDGFMHGFSEFMNAHDEIG